MGERRPKGNLMKRSTLSPEHSAWLAATIARNSRFAGMRMMADGDDGDKGGDGTGGAELGDKSSSADKSKDEPADADKLGEGGKKAIEAERARAKAADDRAKALEGEFSSFKKALLDGFGIKTDDGDKGEDALAAVQAELKKMQDKSEIDDLAREYKITDTKDLNLLKSATGTEARKALAERLAPAEDDSDAKSDRRRPKPDRTQGGGSGGGDGKPRGGSVAQIREERRAAREAKNKTNV